MYIVNLYNIRWKKKYTQEEIAQATGLSKKTINLLFSGRHYDYKLSTLETIADFFGCNINDILIKVDNDNN
ncbi:MAG: helix-turn-helix transcriptional regulator [Candidatus Gastranaerophilales bacterium]|nr:helix-turn-helix transcriptional regulator [Candidatus Gastranaerophilales bacterium]